MPTSRRHILGGLALGAVTTLALVAAVLAPDPVWGAAELRGAARLSDPDAHLLALCAAYRAALARRQAISAAWDADTGHLQATDAQWDARWDAAVDEEYDAAEAVRAVRPWTLAGLVAKAAVAQAVIAAMRSPGELLNHQEVCADAVLADLVAVGGGA